MGKRIVTLISLVILLSIANLYAQDPGIRDTVRIDSIKVLQGSKAVLNVNFYNDEELAGIQLPIVYTSPDITIDSVSFVGSRVSYIGMKIVTIDNSIRQAVIAIFVATEANIAAGNGLLCKIHFNIPAAIPDQNVVVDTLSFPSAGDLFFIDPNAEPLYPSFLKGKITIGNPQNPPIIRVSPDSMYFEGIAGGSMPPVQIMNITNIGQGSLKWTATKHSTWLNVSPSFGTAPSNVQVFANTSSLGAGYYYDTIVVSDTNATNDPVIVPIKLRVMLPPPIIHLSQTYFSFNAIADSANPPNQTLIVTNTGQGVMHWTASKLSSWLTIIPTSGVDSGNITLSVNITGLPYGIYNDTITVSDPNATNDPQKAVIRLEVASGLPLLAVDSPFIFVVVDLNNPFPTARNFHIYNAGGGSMNYHLTSISPRIISLIPDSGAVPQTVTAGFKTLGGGAGNNFFDTVWIYSNEAINSPQFVVFQFHYVEHPAIIVLNKDSIVADLYECTQGTGTQPLPTKFSIFNYGTDPMTFNLTWKSSWLSTDKITGTVPSIITLNFDYKALAPGPYYDTIIVSAINAINSPVRLPVVLNILPASMPPWIAANSDTIFFTAQENRPGKEFYLDVTNANPGCMSWQLNESISWLFYDIDSTNNHTYPWSIHFMPFAGGITMGSYLDQCQIISPSATNSPFPIRFKFVVWKLYGDCDYDGIVNIRDATYLINYLYKHGPAPKPEIKVADCDCNYRVNAIDVTELINYLYKHGNPLCGNPY